MINLVRSEWIKFRSVRSTVVLLVLAGLLVVVVAFFAGREQNKNASDDYCEVPITQTQPSGDGSVSGTEFVPCSSLPGGERPATNLGDLTVGLPFALFLLGALGVQVIGQEYRFNTIRPTFTAMPRRVRVLVAKLAVVSLACAAVSVLMIALCALVGTLMVDNFTVDDLDRRVMLGTVLFTVGWAAMGMGVGAILRQPVAGILVLLGEALVLENLVAGIFHGTSEWMPFLNGIQMTVRDEADPELFRSVLAGGIYFFIVATVVWVTGAVLANRRDA